MIAASESTEVGVLPGMSALALHADAALNAMAQVGLTAKDIDGIATAGDVPQAITHYLGITPRWVDATAIGGCSFIAHVRHAAAAIEAGLCETVLITHGESGRSRVGEPPKPPFPSSHQGQFEHPYGTMGPPTLFTLPVRRYLHDYGIGVEKLAMVPVIQREWASRNPRALHRDLVSVDDVLNSRMIADPFRILMCCPVTDGGGAIIMTSADRGRDLTDVPVYLLGGGESVTGTMVSQMPDMTSSVAFRVSGESAFRQAGLAPGDIDHLMIYDAFAHLPLYGLEDLGFCKRGEAADFVAERNTAPGGSLPLNTNGGGLSYTHTGKYGMFALQESLRQLRGEAAAQVEDVHVSLVHGVGFMFAASSTVIFSNVLP